MKKKQERINQIVELVQKRKAITIKELAITINVSEMTIRRDLKILEGQSLIKNMNGTIIYNSQASHTGMEQEYSLPLATISNAKEKDRIGAYAATLINKNELVIIDNGSTTQRLATHIPLDLETTILCYNINILNELYHRPNISLIFGGGYFHSDTLMFESSESIALIERTRAAKVFISCAGIHKTLGVTCSSDYELNTKKAVIKSGAEHILLTDSSKFGLVKPCYFTDLSVFHKIITDKNLSERWIEYIENLGIELIMV